MEQSDKDYKRAIMVLNSMQEEGIFADFENKKTKQIDLMKDCLKRIRLDEKMDQIDKLSIIHVAGTKGKGSTCEYAESILRHHGYKTGLFGWLAKREFDFYTAEYLNRFAEESSPGVNDKYADDLYKLFNCTLRSKTMTNDSTPHLFDVRERVRINGTPVDKDTFTTEFWHVFDRLHMSKLNNNGRLPGYFNMTLLVALRIFVQKNVDVLVLEACKSGEYDATNFIEKPVVCGVSSLGLEPWNQVGNTIEEVSWHKAGIVKEGIPLVTVKHDQESVMSVILKRAKEKESPLFIALPVAVPVEDEKMKKKLGATSGRRARNAGLAIQLCRIWRQKTKQDDVPEQLDLEYKPNVNSIDAITKLENKTLTKKEQDGLTKTKSPGRTEVVMQGKVTYYLDAAKTKTSLKQTLKWFNNEADKEGNHCRSLVFSMEETEVAEQLQFLNESGKFRRVAFCPHIISSSARDQFPDSMDITKDPAKAEETAKKQWTEWNQLQGCAPSGPHCFPSIASALWWAGLNRDTTLRRRAEADINLGVDPVDIDFKHVQVLVTGSLVVVGGALALIKPNYWEC